MKRTRKPKPELRPDIAALTRLTDDGASDNATIRRRIALIAAERNLDPSETKALMKGRWLTTFHLCQFAKRYRLSVDWLIGGDLKGRLKMARRCPSLPRQDALTAQTTRREQEHEFRRLMLQLKPDQLPALVEILRQQFDNGGSAA